MKPPEQLKQQVLQEKRWTVRLQMAASRVEAAEQERIWAIVSAHTNGVSIRKIATVTGLSSSRVHQLLYTEEAEQIAQGVSALKITDGYVEEQSADIETSELTALQQSLSDEGEVLRWCIQWLEQLARGESVVVNLRPPSDARTAFVSFDRARVMQVLKRIAASLDLLSGKRTPSETIDSRVDLITASLQHRQRLAEPEPQLASLSQREQRAILREKMGLPPM